MSERDIALGTAAPGPFERGSPQIPQPRAGQDRPDRSSVLSDNDLALGKDLPVLGQENQMGALTLVLLIGYQQRDFACAFGLFSFFYDACLRVGREGADIDTHPRGTA